MEFESLLVLSKGPFGSTELVRHAHGLSVLKKLALFVDPNVDDGQSILSKAKEEYAQRSTWIVHLEDAWVDLTPTASNACFLFEALSHGSMSRVRDLSPTGGFIPEPALAAIIAQVLLGLGDLERAHRVHRSIQPSHILLDASGAVKIAGFGFSKKLRTSTTLADTFVGFSEYMAPERVSFSGTHSLVSDIWSLGICALEWVLLESAWAPFTPSTMDPMAMVNLIADACPAGLEMLAMREDISQECKDFIQGCLVPSPAERLTVGELLESPWIFTVANNLEMAKEIVRNWLQESGIPPLV